MSEQKIIAQKKLSGETKYNVCFECLDRTGKNFKEIQPMFYVTTVEEREITDQDGNTFTKIIFDNHYFCPICKKTFQPDDFRKRYTCRADKTKWSDTPKMAGYYGE